MQTNVMSFWQLNIHLFQLASNKGKSKPEKGKNGGLEDILLLRFSKLLFSSVLKLEKC